MFSDPSKIVEQCGIQPGMDVADIGTGSGFYAIAIARAMLSSGRVYAIDAQKDLLSKLKNNAAKAGIYNIEVIWGDIEKPNGTKLRDNSVDMAFLCNVLFQLEDKQNIIKEVRRILKPSGKVLVVDWSDSSSIGPGKGFLVKKDKLMSLFEKAGFHNDREISAGQHHYGIIFKKL